jgi:hypothetical protein
MSSASRGVMAVLMPITGVAGLGSLAGAFLLFAGVESDSVWGGLIKAYAVLGSVAGGVALLFVTALLAELAATGEVRAGASRSELAILGGIVWELSVPLVWLIAST